MTGRGVSYGAPGRSGDARAVSARLFSAHEEGAGTSGRWGGGWGVKERGRWSYLGGKVLSATGAVRANAKRGAARGGLRGRARAGHAGTGEGTRGGQTEACRRAGHLLENDFKHFDLCCA